MTELKSPLVFVFKRKRRPVSAQSIVRRMSKWHKTNKMCNVHTRACEQLPHSFIEYASWNKHQRAQSLSNQITTHNVKNKFMHGNETFEQD